MGKTKFVVGTAVNVMVLSLFTACSGNNGKDIGNEKTQTIALSDAGVAKDEVTRLNDFEILAEDRSILESNKKGP
ncbi:hypothetical protein [Enterococcus gallinarum]|uniref:hypothetical protein n=1 Tax=Enterococcus gallinarum TaxID=1353 RepID=UPI001AD6B595|nr:hypothetical protein [Enterococcus gallinarum]